MFLATLKFNPYLIQYLRLGQDVPTESEQKQ